MSQIIVILNLFLFIFLVIKIVLENLLDFEADQRKYCLVQYFLFLCGFTLLVLILAVIKAVFRSFCGISNFGSLRLYAEFRNHDLFFRTPDKIFLDEWRFYCVFLWFLLFLFTFISFFNDFIHKLFVVFCVAIRFLFLKLFLNTRVIV